MKKNLMKLSASLAPVAAFVLPAAAFAATDDLSAFNTAVASGTSDGVAMLGTFSTQGIVLTIAAIGAGIAILIIKFGAKKGVKAMKGKVG